MPPTGRVALAPLIESLAAALNCAPAERGMRFALSFPPELPDAIGDRDELAQVFQNLFDNAVKYGRPDTEIRITAEAAGLSLRVAVADCGDGISPEHLPRLTERFSRHRHRALARIGRHRARPRDRQAHRQPAPRAARDRQHARERLDLRGRAPQCRLVEPAALSSNCNKTAIQAYPGASRKAPLSRPHDGVPS